MPELADIEARQATLATALGDAITCDTLTRDFVMFQRRRGHRHSTDDLLTAWYAVRYLPTTPHTSAGGALRILDLGSGIGSIGLAVLWAARARSRGARLTAVEAQEVSFRLLRENIAVNGVDDAALAIHGDLREVVPALAAGPFDLVTGSPPYFDVKAGVVSEDSQRAHARFELRGDVRDYARAAARVLAPGGRFVLCFPTAQRKRAEDACDVAGFARVAQCDVVPRAGLAPLFSLFACAHAAEAAPGSGTVGPDYVVRTADGAHTAEHSAARAVFGFEAQ
jgi:tRNA1(Val) A37 N6-methylase TrmN6